MIEISNNRFLLGNCMIDCCDSFVRDVLRIKRDFVSKLALNLTILVNVETELREYFSPRLRVNNLISDLMDKITSASLETTPIAQLSKIISAIPSYITRRSSRQNISVLILNINPIE